MSRIALAQVFALLVALLQPALARAASPLGAACVAPGDCDSGFCVDGACCNLPCAGACEACAAKLKQSAQDSGSCGPVRAGTDPDGDCSADAASSCGKTGSCAGNAAKCALYPTGTACGATSCIVNNTIGMICDGLGSCYAETTPLPCDSGKVKCLPDAADAGTCGSACPGHCASPCSGDGECLQADETCLGGACVKKLPLGAACNQAGDCAKANCVDGVCCDKPCLGQCERCDATGSSGTCSLVTNGAPVSPRPACVGVGACAGMCAGLADQCTYPDQGTECEAAACSGDSLAPASRCDGTGGCAKGTPKDCGAYACDASKSECFTSCTTSAACAGANACDVSGGVCFEVGNSCADEWTVKTVDGTLSSCGGYRCVVGKCQQQCSDGGDCAPGYACESSQCSKSSDGGAGASGVDAGGGPSPTPSDSSGGCGCRLSAASGAPTWLLPALLTLWAARRRRRGQRRPRGC